MRDVQVSSLLHPLPLGIAAGLFFGKQAGVFLFSWTIIKLRLAQLPEHTSWKALYGVSILCGIGFTMSLFIGSLALEPGGLGKIVDQRIGILTGSLLSAVGGYLFLKSALKEGSPNGA